MPMPCHEQERGYSAHERLVDEITHQIHREAARHHTDGMLDNAKHLLHRGGVRNSARAPNMQKTGSSAVASPKTPS